MTEADSPLVFAQVKTEEEPVEVLQTGYDQMDITVLKALTHIKSGTDPVALITDLVPAVADCYTAARTNGFADFLAAAPTSWLNRYGEWGLGGDNNMTLIGYIAEMAAQGFTYIKGYAAMQDMEMQSWSDGTDGVHMIDFFETMLTALQDGRLEDVFVADDDDPPANKAELLPYLQWRGFGAETYERHDQWMRRWVFVIGLALKPFFPRFNERFEQMNNVQIERTVYTFLSAAFMIVADLLIGVAPMQSDRAAYNIGFLNKGILNPKVPAELATAISANWGWISRVVQFSETTPSEHTFVPGTWFDGSQVNGTTLEDSIEEYVTQFVVCDIALKLGRQMFGIGLSGRGGQKVDFMVLWDIANGKNDNGVYPLANVNHGITQWTVGLNTAISIAYLKGTVGRDKVWKKALTNRRHWSYDDIAKFADSIFVDFSMMKSIMGLCENDAYLGIRASVHFVDTNEPQTWVQSYFNNPRDMIANDGIAWKADIMTGSTYVNYPACPWMIPIVMATSFSGIKDYIYFPVDLTFQELAFWMRYGLLVDRKFSTDYGKQDMYRIYATRSHYVQYINSRTQELQGYMYHSSGSDEEPRFECLPHIQHASYPSISMKYSCAVVPLHHAVQIIRTAPRPFGIKDQHGLKIEGMGHNYKMAMKMLSLIMVNPSSSGSPKVSEKAADIAPATPAAPEPKKEEEAEA